jgi:hypothetical protein
MGIEWFRDLFICILGAIAIVVLIFIAILAYSIYRNSQFLIGAIEALCQRADKVIDNLETTSETVRGITTNIKQAMTDPLAQLIAIVQGIRQGINMVNKFFKKKGETENE